MLCYSLVTLFTKKRFFKHRLSRLGGGVEVMCQMHITHACTSGTTSKRKKTHLLFCQQTLQTAADVPLCVFDHR